MAVIVCLFIRLLWLVCGVQGSHGCYIVWCLHLGPFSSAAVVHGDYRLFCVQKPCLPSKWGFRGKKKKKRKKNSTWKYHNVLNISSLSTGIVLGICWFSFLHCYFSLLFSNCYLPTGHQGLLLRRRKKKKKKKAWICHYILKSSADLQGKHSNPLTMCGNQIQTPSLSL